MLFSAESLATPDDNTSVDSPDPRPFEGVEKKLTLRWATADGDVSLRKRVEEDYARELVKSVGASVLSVISNAKVTAYLLSESSLFVFDDQIILKTCGSTKIFNALGPVCAHVQGQASHLAIVEIVYSRPTFMFPDLQPGVYGKFDAEVTKLLSVAGSIPDTSWEAVPNVPQPQSEGLTFHCCVLKNTSTQLTWARSVAPAVDVALFFPHERRLVEFFPKDPPPKDPMEADSSSEATELEAPPDVEPAATAKASGLSDFLPLGVSGFQCDEFLFEPCGYSMNAIDDNGCYWSVHATPESDFSYISVETNSRHIKDLPEALRKFYCPKKHVSLTR